MKSMIGRLSLLVLLGVGIYETYALERSLGIALKNAELADSITVLVLIFMATLGSIAFSCMHLGEDKE